jgi:putative endonuclease
MIKIFTYLIKSTRSESYHIGISKNVEKRIAEHNSGKLKTTSKNKPYTLVYKKEHESYEEARKHEKWLKKKNRKYKKSLEDHYNNNL